MSAEPPAPTDPVVLLVAAGLDMVLPSECVAGVGANLAILATHWAALRASDDPEAAQA